MNFIRDIIGEKRQLNGQAAAQSVARQDDRSLDDGAGRTAEALPAQQGAEQMVETPSTSPEADPWLTDEPAAQAADDLEESSDLSGFGLDDDDFADEAAPDDDDDAPDAILIKPDRNVYEELRSIFVAEEKDRVKDSDTPLTDTASLATTDDHAPLRAAIARVGREYGSEGTPPAVDLAEDGPEQPDEADNQTVEADDAPRRMTPRQELRAKTAEAARTPEPEMPAAADEEAVAVPGPAMGRGSSQKGRVKTRLLGFNVDREEEVDPISGRQAAKPAAYTKFPLGWLIVTDGPGRGAAFTLFNGVSQIGRGKDQTISLDFGDNTISRENHAAIAYDPTQNCFFIGHGGKANLVRRNDRPVLATEELSAGDRITIGETSLRFVPLCGEDFSWQAPEEGRWSNAVNG